MALIIIGLLLTYVTIYYSASHNNDKKKQKAWELKVIAVIWLAVGALIY